MHWFIGSQVTVTSGDSNVDSAISRNTKYLVILHLTASSLDLMLACLLHYCIVTYLLLVSKSNVVDRVAFTQLFRLINCSMKKVYWDHVFSSRVGVGK